MVLIMINRDLDYLGCMDGMIMGNMVKGVCWDIPAFIVGCHCFLADLQCWICLPVMVLCFKAYNTFWHSLAPNFQLDQRVNF